ncbi:hypothetical protein FACS189476_04400 [Spirochaetia bacterium]|nr:hypothetical protein FACS189476_04400 [Spirochaetia bacterium]
MVKLFKPITTIFIILALSSCASMEAALRNLDAPVLREYRRQNAVEDINGDFPEAVYIKTKTQTFNTYHYYILKDGLIYYKLIDPVNGPFPLVFGRKIKEPKEWTLFDEIKPDRSAKPHAEAGLPHAAHNPRFNRPKKIVEISADADELVALSDEGGFYRFCFDENIARRNNMWHDKQGWPKGEQLFLDSRTAKNITWALGKRNNQVLYYEDTFGNQHHNGTMEIATTYMLLEDGQEICYADTGLPADFSRNYIGPERGAFKAVSLSASASTMFVINETGEMYTRLADFDVIGCDPMFFKYTYVPYKSDLPGTNYFSNLNEWALPAEDWRAQSRIPLAGGAALTPYITILQNGQGNSARELRVAGFNEQGETGYWTKAIFADSWQFKAVPLNLPKDSVLQATQVERGERGQSPDVSLRGFFWNENEKEADWEYEIPNFNILEGSCDLRITKNGETGVIKLHPVELWTHLKRDYVAQGGGWVSSDGDSAGAPKLFFVTLEIPEGAFAGLSEKFTQELTGKYAANDKKLFQYTMAATTHQIILRDNDNINKVLYLTDGTISDYFPGFRPEQYFETRDEFLRAQSPELVFAAYETPKELREKIILNQNFLKEIKTRIVRLRASKEAAAKVTNSYLVADFFSHITFLKYFDLPKIKTMTSFGKRIVLINKGYSDTMYNTRIALYQDLVALLQERIKEYRRMERKLAG